VTNFLPESTVFISCKIQLFVMAKSVQDTGPHGSALVWHPDPHLSEKLGPDPH
jgi:hypothetical protein